ncbi:MAG: hypothetical protein R2822_11850 [Spirosomataceae bacterium]
MDPFVALVHDFKNDRAELYRQLDAQIEHVEAHQKLNYALDAIVMDRRFLQVSRSIEQIMSELQGFKTALFGTTDCGLSPKELYLTSKPSQAFMPLPQFRDFCFDEKLSHFITRLNRYEQYAIYLSSTHPWHERVSFATITFQELQTIHTTINEVKEELTLIEQKTKKWLGRSFALEDVLKINTEKIIIDQWLQVFDDEQVWVFLRK